MQIGQFVLEFDVIMRRARYVARSARTSADAIDGFVHCRQHRRVLPHAEIVVRAPNGDRFDGSALDSVGFWKCAAAAVHIGERAVSALGMESMKTFFKFLSNSHHILI
jgi:hypothetical protein